MSGYVDRAPDGRYLREADGLDDEPTPATLTTATYCPACASHVPNLARHLTVCTATKAADPTTIAQQITKGFTFTDADAILVAQALLRETTQ